jgi:hypothetical protein
MNRRSGGLLQRQDGRLSRLSRACGLRSIDVTPDEKSCGTGDVKRFALFGTSLSVDEARAVAAARFGEVFKPYMNDYYGAYWLGHWHIPAGQSEWYGDEVKICQNIVADELGTRPKEPEFADSPTLLYLSGSSPEIEDALQAQGFALLRINEV